MSDDMRTFRTDIELAHPARPDQAGALRQVLVDTGTELSWVPSRRSRPSLKRTALRGFAN
jgi:hypothetical protein